MVALIMTTEENIDQLKKDLAKLTSENQQLRSQVANVNKAEKSSQFENTLSSLRKLVDHKELVIQKLKSDKKEANSHFQMTLLHSLRNKSQLMRMIESLSELVVQTQRISISNVSKNIQDLSIDHTSPKIESSSSIWKPFNSNTRKPEQSIRNSSLKSVSAFGSLDRDGYSIRLDRAMSRPYKDIRSLVDRRSTEISERVGMIAKNLKEIANAQSAMSEFQAELKTYQQRLSDCNIKTIKAMISLKEGQIQTKSSSIQELIKQNQLLKTEIDDIKLEINKLYSVNKMKLKSFDGFIRSQVRILSESGKRDNGLMFDVLRRYSIVPQTFKKLDLALSHFRELRLVNQMISQEYLNSSEIQNRIPEISNVPCEIKSRLNVSLENALQYNRTLSSPDAGKPFSRDSCTQESIKCEPVNPMKTSIPHTASDFKAIVMHLSNKLEKLKSIQSELLSNIQGSYGALTAFGTKLEGVRDAVAATRAKLDSISLILAREHSQSSLSNHSISNVGKNSQNEKMILLSKQVLDLKQHLVDTEAQFSQQISTARISISKLGHSCKLIKQLEMISEESKLEVDIFGSFEVILSSCQPKNPETEMLNSPESRANKVHFTEENPQCPEKSPNQNNQKAASRQMVNDLSDKINQMDLEIAKAKSKNSDKLPDASERRSSTSIFNVKAKPLDSIEKQKFEEQVHYLLSIISGYEKAFEALKKDQEMHYERKRLKSELKSKELEIVLDKFEERPEANIVCLYQNSNENLSSFKEISENLQINITSLKVLDSKVVEKILAETVCPINVTTSRSYPYSEQLIPAVEQSGRLTNVPLSTRRMSQDTSPKIVLFKTQLMAEFRRETLKQIKAISRSDYVNKEALKIAIDYCKAICDSGVKSFEAFADNFVFRLTEAKRSVIRLSTKLSNIKLKIVASKEQRDSPFKASDALKNHSLALRLKEQTDRCNEISETLYQIKRIMTIHTSTQNLTDMSSDQLLCKLEESLQNAKNSITQSFELQLKVDELTQKLTRQTNELKAHEEEINDLTGALESETQRADNALRSHEADRQVLRKQLLQLTQEKVELEEKNDKLNRRIEVLESDSRDKQKIIKGLYESLCSVNTPTNSDFSFADALKKKESSANFSLKFEPSQQDDISFEDIAARFTKKELNSDFLNEGTSEKFIKQFEESKYNRLNLENIKMPIQKTESILEELDKEDVPIKPSDDFRAFLRAHQQFIHEPCNPVSVFATESSPNENESDNSARNFITKKVIDFNLNSEESIRQMPKTESAEILEYLESDFKGQLEESGGITALFQPKYIKDSELESYKEIDDVGVDPVVVDGIELFSFKHSY